MSRRSLPRIDPRHVEQVLDELRLHARVALDDVERLGLSRRVERARRSIATQPKIALSGVRSSCETVATNSSLARLSDSAVRRAACSRSSAAARCRSASRSAVVSRKTTTIPRSVPSAVWIGAALSPIGISRPSRVMSRPGRAASRRRRGGDARERARVRLARTLVERDEHGVERRADGSVSRHPVSASATGLRIVTRPSASVAMTASPMLLSVTNRRASLRSPVTRAACSRHERVLELARRPRPLPLRVVALLQPPLEDAARVAQALGEVVELGDARVPGRRRLAARHRPRRRDRRDLGADDAPADDEGEEEAAAEDGDADGHEEPERRARIGPSTAAAGQAEADGPAGQLGRAPGRERRDALEQLRAPRPPARVRMRRAKSSLGLPPR